MKRRTFLQSLLGILASCYCPAALKPVLEDDWQEMPPVEFMDPTIYVNMDTYKAFLRVYASSNHLDAKERKAIKQVLDHSVPGAVIDGVRVVE